MEALLAKIGWALGLIAAAAGSAFSLFIDPQKTKEMRTLTIWMTMLYGAGIGFLFGGAINEYFKITPISFFAFANQWLVGMMGIAALVEAKAQLKIAITALRKKWIGGE